MSEHDATDWQRAAEGWREKAVKYAQRAEQAEAEVERVTSVFNRSLEFLAPDAVLAKLRRAEDEVAALKAMGTSESARLSKLYTEALAELAALKAENERLLEQVRHSEEWDEKFQCIHCRYYEPLSMDEWGGDVGVFCCFTNTGKGDRVACGEWEHQPAGEVGK